MSSVIQGNVVNPNKTKQIHPPHHGPPSILYPALTDSNPVRTGVNIKSHQKNLNERDAGIVVPSKQRKRPCVCE
jgi:hypothetical protein